MLWKFCTIRFYGSWLVGVNLQCAVDDALDLVHDVVLGEQMLEIPEHNFLPICFFKKKMEPVCRESGEGDGGAAVEAEDGVGGRARTVRRIHLCRLQALSWLFPRQRWQCQEWQYKDENDNTSEEY